MTIDMSLVSKAFNAARSRLQDCHVQINAYAETDEHYYDYDRDDVLQDISEALTSQTHMTRAAVGIVLQLLRLNESLRALDAELTKIENKIGQVSYFDEYLGPHNVVVDLLASHLDLITPLVEIPSHTIEQRQILVRILRQLPHYLEITNNLPSKEKHLQDALLPLLRLAFPDVISHPPTSKQTKTYFPDFGIDSLKTAIEIKFVDEKAKAPLALGELYEDMKGYADSGFSFFIGLIYMTANFITKEQVDAELNKVGIPKSWKVYPVFGPSGKVIQKKKIQQKTKSLEEPKISQRTRD